MKKALMLAALVMSASALYAAQEITGDWQGTLKAGGGELRLVLHVNKGADGSLKATLDSIDQNANGIPVTSISLQGAKLNFTVDSVHGSYEGTVSADSKSIDGTWTQGQPLPLTFERTAKPPTTEHKPAKPSDIDGEWSGTLSTSMVKLRIVFHITNTEDGLTATMDSPDQGANRIPVTVVTRNGASLTLELKQIGGKFEGKIGQDLSTIDGTWTQGGGSLPLALKRVKDAAELERPRPQNPLKPYPYREQEVTFPSHAAGVVLAGTLTLPPSSGPFPAVALVAGSGPHGRDELVLGHRPFLVLADYLTRQGIVVLRYDKRGIGKSTGDYASATTADFADDAQGAVAYLKTRPEANPHKVGLIGHSEGGIIAPIVAARDRDVAFIVMMAGTGVPGSEVVTEQTVLIAEASGQSPEQAEKKAAEDRAVINLVKNEQDAALLEKQLRAELAGTMSPAEVDAAVKLADSPWSRYFLFYDPATALRQVKCPVLVLNGEKDLQVSPKQNLPPIRKALEEGGNKNFEVDELPGLNHLFQHARTGGPSEYAEISETIAPEVLKKIGGWILAR
jgi:uncharacterized protein